MSADWSAIEALPKASLSSLFVAGDDRLKLLAHDSCGMRFDFAKTHLTADAIAAFEGLARAQDFAAKREALFAGGIVNPSEGRAAEHTAQRGEGSIESVALAKTLHDRMRTLIDAIEGEALGPIRHIVHIGIGGSALGPDLIVDALSGDRLRYDVAIVSNVDGYALENAVADFDPAATLIVVASKTFTTTETMLNAGSALAWLEEHDIDDPYSRVIALTAAPEKAMEWGVDATRVLPFPESVGGRYSLWSAIGLPIAIAIGAAGFREFLAGAHAMDTHFRKAPLAANLPVRLGLLDVWYRNFHHFSSRSVAPYHSALRRLPAYLQQLEMESNGKRVDASGAALPFGTSPVPWGESGTNGQHAYFQMLHQGTDVVPVEFVAVKKPRHSLQGHHDLLLANVLAQAQALMQGKADGGGHKHFPGNRPSTLLLLDDLTPASLGALIALQEHRVFVSGALWGINSFDQWGVELGKVLAKDIAQRLHNGDASGLDGSTAGLLQMLRRP